MVDAESGIEYIQVAAFAAIAPEKERARA